MSTNMWGYNVIDIAHAVRRAQTINSDIKSWGLKYITQFIGEIKKLVYTYLVIKSPRYTKRMKTIILTQELENIS